MLAGTGHRGYQGQVHSGLSTTSDFAWRHPQWLPSHAHGLLASNLREVQFRLDFQLGIMRWLPCFVCEDGFDLGKKPVGIVC
jgi:hypothetical protein